MTANLECLKTSPDSTHNYTDEQKVELTKILAQSLYKGFLENVSFESTLLEIKRRLQEVEWFTYGGNLFPHLEQVGIKGAYDFPLVKTTRFYVRICFPDKFQKWLFSFLFPKKPPFERYLELYMSDKVHFKKPTPEKLSGNWSIEKGGPRTKSRAWTED